jgi:hypothetical protein
LTSAAREGFRGVKRPPERPAFAQRVALKRDPREPWRESGMKKVLAAISTAVLAASAAPALAHHSGSMFDPTKTVTIEGTVKEFQYTNPHSWLEVVVTGPDGKVTEWGFEAEGPSTLLRAGIKAKSLQPGDKVTVVGHPMKDGRTAGSLMQVTKADGTVLSPRNRPQVTGAIQAPAAPKG